MGSLSLLQGIFLTQESNHGLLRCRQILYRLEGKESKELPHQGSPGGPLPTTDEKAVQGWVLTAERREDRHAA